MAITSVRPSTPVTTTKPTEKPDATSGDTTLPLNTADATPATPAASGPTVMQQIMKYMDGQAMSAFQDAQAEAKKEDQEFEDEMKEEDARNGVE
ncbi:MAG: hypothetical protein V4695_06730 [Pseudomonadota bacterium]